MNFFATIKLICHVSLIYMISVGAFAQNVPDQEQLILKDMIENPQKYHSEIKDITKGHPSGHGMTQEMLRFYTAVAIVESISCAVNNDPTGCELFLESLKDPIGHVGFAAFMVSAKKTSEYAMIMSKGKIPQVIAGNLGLMVGMLVQDLIVELVRDPLVAELMGLAFNKNYSSISEKIERANKIKNELWKKTFGSEHWRDEKASHGLSLLAAVALSSASQKVLGASAVGIAKQLVKYRKPLKVGYKLGKVATLGGRLVRSVTPIGLTLTGIVIFLEWAHVTEKYIGHPMRSRNATYYRVKAQKKLEDKIHSNESIEDEARNLSFYYLNERSVQMEPASTILTGFNFKLNQMSDEFYKVTKYYNWLVKGMPDSQYKENEKEWHSTIIQKDLIFDRPKVINALFCGGRPKSAVKVQKEVAGLPIPFKEYEVSETLEKLYKAIESLDASASNIRGVVIHPYKALDFKDVCNKDIVNLNKEKFDSVLGVGDHELIFCPITNVGNGQYQFKKNQTTYLQCKINQWMMRNQILKTGKSEGRNIRSSLNDENQKAMQIVMKKYETFRMAYIKRYERRIAKTLLEHLTGQKVKMQDYLYRNSDGIYTNVTYESEIKCYKKHFSIDADYPTPSFAGMQLEPSYDNNYFETMMCEGSIPGLYQELDYLKKLLSTLSNKDHIKNIKKNILNAKMQLKYAYRLKRFYETKLINRRRVPDFDLMFGTGDWVSMSNFYENFILNE